MLTLQSADVLITQDTDGIDDEVMDRFDKEYRGRAYWDGSMEDLYRKLEEGHADILAGRVYTNDDFFDDILRSIDDGTI